MTPEAANPSLRLALRAANGFTLDLLKICRGERDFTDALILATLVQCNSAPMVGNLVLQRRYATFATPPPDDTRRPISINAIAASLGMPFETVRRRIRRLIADGFCEATPQGVRLSDAALMSPAHRQMLDGTYETVRSLFGRLKRADCMQLMGTASGEEPMWDGEDRPVRIVWRAASDYVLRMMEHLLPNFPSLSRAFVVLAVARANTDGLSDTVRGEEGVAVESFVPDAYRKPVRASELAAQLGMPHETVRRNLAALIEDGRCVRGRDGFIVPAAVLVRPNVLATVGANFRYLSRMFGELAETGVLSLWDSEASAGAAGPADGV